MTRALVALVLLLALPAGAEAHAVLEGTKPERGAQLDAAPGQVSLRFSEGLSGTVQVFDGGGREVQDGKTFKPAGNTLAVRLPDDLPDGGYTATYRAISADSHPISGGFSFTVGEGGPGAQGVDRLLQGTEAGPVVATGLGVARGFQYAAIALAVGTLLFVALCWPKGLATTRAERLLAVAAPVGLVTSIAGVLLHRAQSPAGVVTQFDVVWALAAAGWIAVFLLRRSGWVTLPAGALCAVPAAGGHASVEGAPMLAANLVHVVAISGWIGGLAALVFALRPATRGDKETAATAIARFSRLAGYLVLVVLLTGTLQSLIELSAWRELTETAYGRAILIKVGLFVVLLGFGAFHRRRALPPLATLRAELAVGVAVLGVTGALATYPPGKSSGLGPVSESTVLGPSRMELTVDPARPGVNEIHLYLFDRSTGAQYDAAKEMTVTAERGELSVPIELRKAGPGHYVAQQAAIPTRGDWTLNVTARVSEFDQYEADLEVPVR